MPIQTAFVLIESENKILLIEEGGEARGKWCLPGGHVDEGETPEQAAIREAAEEANIRVAIRKKILTKIMPGKDYLGPPWENDKSIEIHLFAAAPLSFEIKNGTDELAVGWFTRDEARRLPLRWDFLADLFS